VAFDRHPKTNDGVECRREAAGIIATACIVTAVSAHLGVPPARAFSRLRRKDDSERRHSNVILQFDRPVREPLLLGAGRYRGYGMCRPIRDTVEKGEQDSHEVSDERV
jgi:CRISPR-associated protein Csb2